MKPLDIVEHIPTGKVGLITEGKGSFSIEWFGGANLKCAWWDKEDKSLKVIDNLANFIAKGICHPFGSNEDFVDEFYPIGDKE